MPAIVKHINFSNSPHPSDQIVLVEQLANMQVELSKLQAKIQDFRKKSNSEKILISTKQGHLYISLEKILYCKAASNYCEIYLVDGTTHLLSKTLKIIEQDLSSDLFFRCHQSYLINKKYLTTFSDGICTLESNQVKLTIPVSRRRQVSFLKEIKVL